ncbi:hypothetical protein RBB50_011377 [Rhinocladiella similis]
MDTHGKLSVNSAALQVNNTNVIASDEQHVLEDKEREPRITPPRENGTSSNTRRPPLWRLVTLMITVWLITFTTGFQVQVMTPLLPYVYSNFQAHSLLPTASIVSSVVGAVSRLPLAKIIDIWGRDVGYALTLVSFTIGTITMAACDNVVTYCAASVFFWMGYDCMSYVLYVVIADHFPLSSRGVMFGVYNSPWLISTWVGAPAATAYLRGAGWKWAFGTFSIVCPITGLPLLAILYWERRQDKTEIRGEKSQRSFWESVKYYFVEFDCEALHTYFVTCLLLNNAKANQIYHTVIGLLLVTSGFSLFLLPFSLYTLQAKGWASPMIICMLVFGSVLIVLFVLWEKFLAPKSFIPFPLLKSRTVIGGSVSYAQTWLTYYIWTSYFSSALQVVQDLSVTRAGYVFNIYNIGWSLISFVAGLAINATGRYKPLGLYLGLPLHILTTGLMIYLSRPSSDIASIVVVQILLSLADGVIYISSITAVMAGIDDEAHLAAVLALYNMIASAFQAVGATISSAIWTNTFPEYLARNLPSSATSEAATIYSSIYAQLSYAVGSPIRASISLSYTQAMQKLFITATAISSIGILSTLVWKDIKIRSERKAAMVAA